MSLAGIFRAYSLRPPLIVIGTMTWPNQALQATAAARLVFNRDREFERRGFNRRSFPAAVPELGR